MDASTQPRFSWEDLDQWVEQGLLTPDQAVAIRRQVEAAGPAAEQPQKGPEQRAGLNMVTVAYYFGAFMILFAYSLYMGLQWQSLGYAAQSAITGVTILVLWLIGFVLRRARFTLAGDLLIFAGVAIVPLLVYCLQKLAGVWPVRDPRSLYYGDLYPYEAQAWVALEIASIVAAGIAVWRTRFPLHVLLVTFWSWFLAMELTRMLASSPSRSWSDPEQLVSALLGLAMLGLGVLLQRRTRRDYSFWLYLSGHSLVLVHLGTLALYREGGYGLVFLVVYLAFVVASVWLQRRVFLVFGALGCYIYGTYLAFRTFQGALGFPIAMAVAGLFIVLTAVAYQRFLRPWLAARLPSHARSPQMQV